MKTLLVLRHAKSSWSNAHLSDHDRPLNGRGKSDAPRMGQLLRQKDLVPDLIITSTAKRAFTTAEAVAYASGYEEEIKYTRALYHAWAGTYVEVASGLSDELGIVMMVGHNPGMEELVELLTGQDERMPTAALAHIELPIDRWQALDEETNGVLREIWRPKELG